MGYVRYRELVRCLKRLDKLYMFSPDLSLLLVCELMSGFRCEVGMFYGPSLF